MLFLFKEVIKVSIFCTMWSMYWSFIKRIQWVSVLINVFVKNIWTNNIEYVLISMDMSYEFWITWALFCSKILYHLQNNKESVQNNPCGSYSGPVQENSQKGISGLPSAQQRWVMDLSIQGKSLWVTSTSFWQNCEVSKMNYEAHSNTKRLLNLQLRPQIDIVATPESSIPS